jgi:hypothetical protein
MTAGSRNRRARLDAIELELQQRLLVRLEAVVEGKNSLFFTTLEFNSFNLPEHMLPTDTQELAELSLEAIRLRDLLGESNEQSVGNLFRRALREASDGIRYVESPPSRTDSTG